MALATQKLYYRRGGTTYSLNLYTTTAEVSPNYMVLNIGGITRYIKLGLMSEYPAACSFIRAQKSGVIYSPSMFTYNLFTYFGQAPKPGIWQTVWEYFTLTFDYNKVESQNSLYNLKIIDVPVGGDAYSIFSVDGDNYQVNKGQTIYQRLSTGSHVIGLAAKGGNSSNRYNKATGYYIT